MFETAELIYPNPAEDFVSLPISKLGNTEYSIFNIRGKLVSRGEVNSEKINVQNLKKGTYFLVTDDKTFKLIKN